MTDDELTDPRYQSSLVAIACINAIKEIRQVVDSYIEGRIEESEAICEVVQALDTRGLLKE